MTEQEQFEADYRTAFPDKDSHGLEFALQKQRSGRYQWQSERDAFSVWQQQAASHALEVESLKATHKAEIAELINASSLALEWLKAALECKDWAWDFDQRECAEFSVQQLTTIIAKYEEKQ